MLYLYFCTFYC